MVRRLPTDQDAPRAARATVEDAVLRLRLAEHRAQDASLIVSELVTNAVIHGPPGEVELRVDGDEHLLRIEVEDAGTDAFHWPEPQIPRSRGLDLVELFADRCGLTQDRSTVVWCEIDLDAAVTG